MAKQFWAQIIEADEEVAANGIPGAKDHEEAAEWQVSDFVGAMGGQVTEGAVRVWLQGADGEAKTYDWKAEFTMPDDPTFDADDDVEVEAEIELIERV